jgi:small subunit ribosomal protein S17
MNGEERKTRIGMVVSDKMDKTVVVKIERTFQHPVFKKQVRKTEKCKAHDEGNECRPGDRILIEETRPLSRDKRWRVVRVLGRAD